MYFTVRFKILFAASKSLKISFISLLVKKYLPFFYMWKPSLRSFNLWRFIPLFSVVVTSI